MMIISSLSTVLLALSVVSSGASSIQIQVLHLSEFVLLIRARSYFATL